MESSKVNITEPVELIIKAMHPSDRNLVTGVFAFLEDVLWRDTHKIYFAEIDGVQTWAVAENRVTVAFVEESDGSVTVLYVAMRSRWSPSW